MKERLADVSPSEITLTGWNPREEITGESLEELKTSIEKETIQIRLIVRPAETGYELISGERRLTAAKELKLKTVPVIVREATDEEAKVLMLVENMQRKDLTPLEEASGLQAVIEMGVDPKVLAQRVGRSEEWIQGRLALNAAPEDLTQLLKDGSITAQQVGALVPFIGHPVYDEYVLPRLKEELKWNKQRLEETFSSGRFDQFVASALNDYDAERVLCLTNFPYEFKPLRQLFNDSACKKCTHIVVRKKERYCLNRTCYADKLNQAKQAFEASQTKKVEKLQKGEGVSTKKLEHGTYEYLSGASFDTRPCKKCDKCKVDKRRSSTLDGGKGEQELVCLDPSCFRGKKSAKTRAANKAIKEEKVLIRKSFAFHAVNRKEGLTAAELRFVLGERSYSNRHDPKIASMDQKGLENLLLGETLRRELRDNGYSVAELRSVRRRLPFKVNEKLAAKVELEDEKDEEG